MCTVLLPPGVNLTAVNKYIDRYSKGSRKISDFLGRQDKNIKWKFLRITGGGFRCVINFLILLAYDITAPAFPLKTVVTLLHIFSLVL